MTEKSFTPGRRISSSSSWLNSPITPTKLKSNKELQKQLDYFELLTSRSHHPYKMLVLLLTFHRGNVLFCTWNPSYSFRTFFCNLTESMAEWYSRTICHKLVKIVIAKIQSLNYYYWAFANSQLTWSRKFSFSFLDLSDKYSYTAGNITKDDSAQFRSWDWM